MKLTEELIKDIIENNDVEYVEVVSDNNETLFHAPVEQVLNNPFLVISYMGLVEKGWIEFQNNDEQNIQIELDIEYNEVIASYNHDAIYK